MTDRVPSLDPVYSEADMAEMRMDWERAERERNFQAQIGSLTTALAAMPTQFEQIARRVFSEMQLEQTKHQTDARDKAINRYAQISAIVQTAYGALLVYLAVKR